VIGKVVLGLTLLSISPDLGNNSRDSRRNSRKTTERGGLESVTFTIKVGNNFRLLDGTGVTVELDAVDVTSEVSMGVENTSSLVGSSAAGSCLSE